MSHRRRVWVAAAVTAGVAAAVVLPAVTREQSAQAAGLEPFGDCAELDAWFGEQAEALAEIGHGGAADGGWLERLLPGGDEGAAAESADTVVPAPLAAADASATGTAVGPGATGTNVQEMGVDEPDIVKTDGARVVTVTHDALHVLSTEDGAVRRQGRVELPDQRATELLLLGDRALVLGQRDVGRSLEPIDPGAVEPGAVDPGAVDPGAVDPGLVDPGLVTPVPSPGDGVALRLSLPVLATSTVLSVVDLTDPGAPAVVRTEEVEGRYLSARVSGGSVRVVLSHLPWTGPGDAGPRAEGGVGEWLPHRLERDADGQVSARRPAVECTEVAHPVQPSGIGVLVVMTLDAGAPDVATTDEVGVAADGDQVYASPDRLYVATTRGGWGGPIAFSGNGSGGTTTQLHGFDTSAAGTTGHVASGSVDGRLLGRWAMSARGGDLRVATTVDDATSGSVSVVTVLREDGGRLAPVGSVGGLGVGEQIRAVRWFEDLALVVTFRQTDPLYAVDLADPTAPRVVGELKIPGYSAYLHPLGDGLVLGVGQDADELGTVTGAQVSSFDVRDLTVPTRVDALTWSGSWTDVEADARAFTYLPGERTAYVPLDAGRGGGVVAVRVAEDGALEEVADWSPDGFGARVLRALPVEGGLAAVTEDGEGRAVVLLTTSLDEVGSVLLD